jgi:hypothetical protein
MPNSREVSVTIASRLFSAVVVILLGAACMKDNSSRVNTFLVRRDPVDVQAVTNEFFHALPPEIHKLNALDPRYPLTGYVSTVPDAADTAVELMQCNEGLTDEPEGDMCILLNQSGDFITLSPITWQSAAFHMYRIFVAPRSIFVRVDPTKDYVAIDVFLMNEPELWESVHKAIQNAAKSLGARSFKP